jgi:serine protease AprX
MHSRPLLRARPHTLQWLWLIMAVMALQLTPPAALDAQRAPQAHPLILDLATRQPAEMVSVIVRGTTPDAPLALMVARLGGRITHNLSIVQAVVAELPAAAALDLARSPQVHWVSPNGAVATSAGPDGAVATANLANAYNRAVGAHRLWAEGYQGSSVTVAVVDSGISDLNDFKEAYGGNGAPRILTTVPIVGGADLYKDWYGHGTHIAGIIGGNGTISDGRYIGIAPKVNLVAVDVANEHGAGTTADVIAGLQWINENRDLYNIRVVNISLNASIPESYHTSALDAAVEILWFNGIVVVVSAGNNGRGPDNGILYPPANDPFVITVGATNDRGTAGILTDTMAPFSASGITSDGFVKPEIVAPGTNIISTLSKADNTIAVEHPSHLLPDPSYDDYYFRMSGTSMAAPIVAGAVALLLQDEPHLTPDQVKYRLMATANKRWLGYSPLRAGAGYLDAYAAVKGTTTESANVGFVQSRLLWSNDTPQVWTSANWGSANWGSANWGSANWGSANWGSDYWGP